MNSSSRTARTALWIVALVALLGMLWAFMNTAQVIPLKDAGPVADTLTVDESAYYEYVAPRLEQLVVESDKVVEMVDSRSKDILGLTVSGDRIDTLAAEIKRYGEENGVPPRFASIHENIVSASDVMRETFDAARASLASFDFSNMTNLVPQFKAAATDLHTAQDELMSFQQEPSVP